VIILFSCSGKRDKSVLVPINLTSETLPFRVGIGRVEHILYQNDNLIITKGNPDEQIVIFNLSEGSRKIEGVKGSGPGEIMNPWSLQKGKSADDFWVGSIGQKLLSQFSIQDENPLAKRQIKLVGDAIGVLEPLFLKEDLYIGTNLDGKSIFTFFNEKGDVKNRIGDWAEKKDFGEYPNHVISSVYEGRLRTNSSGTKVSYVCIALDRFMILDVEREEVREFIGPFDIKPDFKVVPDRGVSVFAPSPDTKFGFIDSYLSDDKLYLLYSGLSAKEITQTGKMANQILVYSFKGELLDYYELDESLKSFTVDEENGVIYGLTSFVNDNVKIVKFHL
tara:strand:- start:60357 stop:61358 length:1002 start_codon:yes stop_codon:yes gene_type:complete